MSNENTVKLNKPETIKVKGANLDGVVVIWEIHPDHETDQNKTGEIFITGDGKQHEVARTAEVNARLHAGTLVEVGKEEQPLTAEDEATRLKLNARDMQAANAANPDEKKAMDDYQKTLADAETERQRLEALQQANQNVPSGVEQTTLGEQTIQSVDTLTQVPQTGPRSARKS